MGRFVLVEERRDGLLASSEEYSFTTAGVFDLSGGARRIRQEHVSK